METFKDKMDDKSYQPTFDTLAANQFTSWLITKTNTSDQVDMMFSMELTLPSGVKSLLIFNFYSTQYSETPIKWTPSGPSQLSV